MLDGTGLSLDKTIWMGCIPVLDGQGVQVEKGTHGDEPSTKITSQILELQISLII